MHKKQQQIRVLASASLLVTGIASYEQLKSDSAGNKIHSGVASGGQEVQSYRSKIEKGQAGKPATITLIDPVTGRDFPMTAAGAEVLFAQVLPALAEANQASPALT